MPDTFTLTILFIIICTVVGAFIKGRARDGCLKDFSRHRVILEKKDGKTVWGKLSVESSCLEFIYDKPYSGPTGDHLETSYILYKNEHNDIFALVRYIDDLDPRQMEVREKDLRKTSNPGWCSRFSRRIRNLVGTIRDSLMEVIGLFMGRLKSATPVGKLLEGQDKYVSKVQEQGMSFLGMSYEPVLERYRGKKVVLTMFRGDKKEEYSGILKEYTPEFIEVLEVDYRRPTDKTARKTDLVVPRGVGVVRHAGV